MNGILEKFLSLCLKFLWTLLWEGKPLKKLESDVYPLSYCGHRWCENENCLHCAVEIWPAFNTFFKHLRKLPKPKQPIRGDRKRILVFKKAVDDPLIQAKMKFLELLSPKLNEFLRGFQTYQPVASFSAETLETLLMSFMNMFILKSYTQNWHPDQTTKNRCDR